MDEDIFLCKNSSHHKNKWLLSTTPDKSEKSPCFACCMFSLQDKQILGLNKRIILTFLKDLMASNIQILINTVSSDDHIVLYTIQAFLNLLSTTEHCVSKLSGECLLLFLIHMKKEELCLAVVQRLTVEVEQENDYRNSLTRFHFLGRLYQMFPNLIRQEDGTKSKFMHMLANGLSSSSDDVKSAILFLLRNIYQNTAKNKTDSGSLDAFFLENILRILKRSQNRDLLKNTLGLFQIFIVKVLRNFDILFEISSEEISFIHVVKKFILSNEKEFQICIVQCICQLLSNSLIEKQVSLLLEANVPEILFDTLSTKNELLLESILTCLYLFLSKAGNITKSRFVFGIGIISDISCTLLEMKNWRLLCTALNLLTSIISNNQYLKSSSHITFFYQSILLTEKVYKMQNPKILLATSKFFAEFLKNKNIPWSLPMEQIHVNMRLCLKTLGKFIPSLTISKETRTSFEDSKSIPFEMKVLICALDIVSSCLSFCNHYKTNPISVESRFTSPCSQVQKSTSSFEKSTKPLLLLCLSSVDELFIPCCLNLMYTDLGRIAWYDLLKVLVVLFEEVSDSILIYQLCKKLIAAGIFKYLFGLKVCETSFKECNPEQVKITCYQCVKRMLKFMLINEIVSDVYQNALENGINNLNDSLEECASVLSQKLDLDDARSTNFCATSTQTAFLCLCYLSYLNEAFVVRMKTLIPHLICFVTYNSDHLLSCSLLMKHVIFLMAVCTYECISKRLKFQTGLMEANMILWDILPKLKLPLQVYTHNKYLLWWCFKNETCNQFSSDVLMAWVKFCINETHNQRHFAMKTLVFLLSYSHTAQQTFVMLFDLTSPPNNEAVVKFLKEVYELEVFSETNKKSFQSLVILMIHHLQAFLIKLYIMKNDNDKNVDSILCQGLDFLLWCHKQVNNIEIEAKILFYVSQYCFLANCSMVETLTVCINFLKFTLNHDKHFDKTWHVMTGDNNFPSFFYKCFASQSQLEVEALSLLVTLFNCQINNHLKCNICIKIPPNLILKWLNSTQAQCLAYQLLNLLIKCEFQGDMIILISFSCADVPHQSKQYIHFRLISLYLVNSIVSRNAMQEAAVEFYLQFLNIAGKIDKCLENHIMLQPWIKILLESKLEKLDNDTWKLFDKWLSSNEINTTLINTMQQFANKVQNINPVTDEQKNCIHKLCTGIYASFLSKEMIDSLKQSCSERCRGVEEETDLVTQVQNLVTDYFTQEK